MKKVIILFCLFLSTFLFSQKSDDSNFWNNVRFGGGFGFGFNNNTTTLAISPTAIYDFNDHFSLGFGVGYQYAKQDDFKSNVYNVGIISLYNPFESLQLSLELDQLFINQKFGAVTDNFSVPSLNIGLAYQIGRNVALGIRYDALYDEDKSVFTSPISPIIRVFF